MRVKKSIHNIFAGLGYEMILIVSTFIVPRLILTSFGSDYNGLVSAISQILGMVILLRAGLGGVIRAALFKPLAEGDINQTSVIIKTARAYLRKVAYIFAGITLVLAALYPLAVAENFDWFFTFSLVLIMSLGTLINLFVAAGYEYLIEANQKNSVNYIINTITLILSTTVTVFLIYAGRTIHEVQLGAVLIIGLRPVFVYMYVHRNYKLIGDVKPDKSYLKQRWDNFAQELASFISSNTGLIIISLFVNVFEVSVYVVYMLVANGIYCIIKPFITGVDAAFGSMFAKDEGENVVKGLRVFESVVFSVTTLLLGVTLVMIVPFVMLYTSGVTDVDYNREFFSIIIVAASLFRCYRLPYVTLVHAVGHFKQTRNGAIMEMTINIVSSIILVLLFGIIGVAAGMLISLIFRTVQYALYVSKNIVKRSIFCFIKRIVISLLCVTVIGMVSYNIGLGFDMSVLSIESWIINAMLTTAVGLAVVALVEVLFYREDLQMLLKLFKGAVT